ncbi:MAG: carbohydrate kinase family protein [Anaerovorax sp.]|nr:carbohydrate kinase family protein [Anaerovorax sp.]
MYENGGTEMSQVLLLGGLLLDRFYEIDALPQRGQDGYINRSFDQEGGCTLNMAVTIKNLGGKPYVVSALGKDEWGKRLHRYMEENELPCDCIKYKDGQTGYCMAFIEPDGERTFLTAKGCEINFYRDLVPDEILENIEFAALTGYYLLEGETETEVLLDFMRELKQKNIPILFDPSPLVDKIESEALAVMMQLADVLTPNETEGLFLSHNQDVKKWASNLAKQGKTVFLKNGKQGGAVYHRNSEFQYTAQAVKPVDTTGAGDSFAGALAHCLAKKIPLPIAAQIASSCAAKTVLISGPHGRFSTADLPKELQDYL